MLPSPLILQIPSSMPMTDKQLFDFCQVNSHLRIEKDRFGHLSIMSAIDEKIGNLSGSILEQLRDWSQQHNAGVIFDDNTRFKLSSGANRLPYAAWMKLERWNTLSSAPKEWFISTCPDFVVEIRFINQNLQLIQEKMTEYMQESEIKLGWLIDLQHRQVYIYYPDKLEECLENPVTVSADPVLPGFVLHTSGIWLLS
ncbi:Uma2 family endonuclease [Anabaena sp. CCY 9910]|uniref:Uma2 family endonuclease n=1 Tax=Anabaena sp. CCY 9910 TaxID=3103870 RepID=UPI0039E153F4